MPSTEKKTYKVVDYFNSEFIGTSDKLPKIFHLKDMNAIKSRCRNGIYNLYVFEDGKFKDMIVNEQLIPMRYRIEFDDGTVLDFKSEVMLKKYLGITLDEAFEQYDVIDAEYLSSKRDAKRINGMPVSMAKILGRI